MNQELYNRYAINGFPNHFFTVEATDKYNLLIAFFLNEVKKNL